MKTSVDVPLVKNVVQTYPLAADAAVHAIEVMFQQKPAIDFGPRPPSRRTCMSIRWGNGPCCRTR
ncbi:MAG: hypothetical protein WDM81_08575 [Rhizomicrobium sp.]